MTDLLDAVHVDLPRLVDDLADEQRTLRALVRDRHADLGAPTPAAGWDVGDQLAHLAHGDRLARLAVEDPDAFTAEVGRLLGTGGDLEATVADAMAPWRRLDRDGLLDAWTRDAAALAGAVRGRDASERVTWVTGPMSPASFVRARLMEAVAHGQDVHDALGVAPRPTDRLAHVAYLGVRTRGFSYQLRGLAVPSADVGVVLAAPSGGTWTWGPVGADDRVEGDALDFALVVTRRRHPDDTDLRIVGPAAHEWMELAQCYAGPPSPARPSGTFPDGWRTATREEARA